MGLRSVLRGNGGPPVPTGSNASVVSDVLIACLQAVLWWTDEVTGRKRDIGRWHRGPGARLPRVQVRSAEVRAV